ncbi:MAG: LpxI family protein [Acidobacteriota bacterium]
MNEKKKLGIVAGSGEIPIQICQRAKKEGYSIIAAGIQGEFNQKLKKQADLFALFEMRDFLKLISMFKKNEVSECVFAGKIKHKNIYSTDITDPTLSSLLKKTRSRSPDDIVKVVFDYVERQGIEVIDSSRFLSDLFCRPGVLTTKQVSPVIKEEIEFGWPIAKKMADLEIGQTVVVKDKAVVAVEGMEGTDKTVARGGSLAGKGCVVIKVARTSQDIRIDQPAVGMITVRTLKEAGCSALCIEARKVLFIDKVKALRLAEQNGIIITAKEQKI